MEDSRGMLKRAFSVLALLLIAASRLAAQDGEGSLEGLVEPERALLRVTAQEDRALIAEILGTKQSAMTLTPGGSLMTGASAAFPRASSSLADDGYGPYGPEQADDGSALAAWADGVKGPGIGSWLAVMEATQGDLVLVYPGFSGKTWSRNNRPKAIRVLIFCVTSTGDGEGSGEGMILGPTMIEISAILPDQEGWRTILQPGRLPDSEAYLAVLLIDSVWPGSRYDDTCVAAFGLSGSQ